MTSLSLRFRSACCTGHCYRFSQIHKCFFKIAIFHLPPTPQQLELCATSVLKYFLQIARWGIHSWVFPSIHSPSIHMKRLIFRRTSSVFLQVNAHCSASFTSSFLGLHFSLCLVALIPILSKLSDLLLFTVAQPHSLPVINTSPQCM